MSKKLLGAQEAAKPAMREQPLSDAEKELVREAYARLEVFRDGCKEMHTRAREARKIALLDDPRQDIPGSSERILQLNTLKSTLNNCVADQMDNMPEAVMLPETPGMQERADDVTDVVRFILAQNRYERLHRKLAEDLFITGTAVRQVYWDEDADDGRGNVGVLRWPVEGFLWDPVAESIQDARAIIKVSWHPLSWYAARYPDAAEYVGVESYASLDVGVPDAWAVRQSGDEDRAMMLEYWYRKYDARTRRYTINVAYLAGGALLEHAEGVYAHGLYPFMVDAFNAIEGMPVGDGMVLELAPTMRYINRYYHYLDFNMRMAAKPKMLVMENAGIDNDALTDFNVNVVKGKTVDKDSLRWLETPLFSGAASGVAIQLQTDIKQDSGQNQFTRGETAGGVTAASAIAALQEAGGKVTRLRTATLNRGFEEMVTQIIWLAAQFYTDKQKRLVTGKDEHPREVDMSSQALFGAGRGAVLPPPYTVQVQVQRRNPMRVAAQNDLFLQTFSMAMQGQVNFPLSLLFELLTVDGKDRILPAVRRMEQEQQALQQAQQAIEQLAAQNQELEQGMANMRQALERQTTSAGAGMYAGGSAPA